MTEISDRRVPVKEVCIVPKQAELTYTEERASPGSLRDNKDGHIVPKQAQLTYTKDNAQPGSLWDIKDPVNKDVNKNTQPKRNVPAAKDNKKDGHIVPKQAQLTYTEDNAQPGSLWDIKEPVNTNKDVNKNTQPKRNVPAAKDNKKENIQRAKQPLKEKNTNVNNSNFGTRDVPFKRASGERISLPKSKNAGKKYWSWSLRHKP